MQDRAPAVVRHSSIYRDPHAYAAHPHVVTAADGTIVVVFNEAPRRAVTLHPPEDPMFRNLVTRSGDQGRTWSHPEPVPGYNWHGMECAGLTLLADGRIMLNQWQFGWMPRGLALTRGGEGRVHSDRLLSDWSRSLEHDTTGIDVAALIESSPWARGPGRALVHFSDDHGTSFGDTVAIDVAPFGGGYGMRGGIQLAGGRIILPLSDVPHYREVFVVESTDGGAGWTPPRLVAKGPGHAFEEPAIAACGDGTLVIVMRDNETRQLHRCVSVDAGLTWSTPAALPIDGYPAQLLLRGDGRLLLTYALREGDRGIRAVVSDDTGRTWNADATVVIRGGMRNRNLGYPATVELAAGEFMTVYYCEDRDGVTGISATFWS